MYKTAVPISINSMRDEYLDEDLRKYLEYFSAGNITRVFIAILPGMYSEEFRSDINSHKLKTAISFFKEHGLEVGVWIGSFGHGSALSHEDPEEALNYSYQKITGVMGEAYEYGYCPLDEKFVSDYTECIKKIALQNPDMIMLDDDFRLNCRRYYLGCFCEKHLREFYRLVGEEIPRDKIERLAFSGKRNKYRDAFMKMSRDTLMNFAKKVREAVDEINPNIRLGNCTVPSVWDFEGSDVVELSKCLAGEATKPFLRTFGAPYHCQYDVIREIEETRMEHNYVKSKDDEVETFSEGDLYPRPRYNVASKPLELFDLALCCDGKSDGILKYVFDYTLPLDYETGYVERHIKLKKTQSQVKALFDGKAFVGVSVFYEMHRAKDWDLTETDVEKPALAMMPMSLPTDLIAKNGIPTCYEPSSEYPVVVSGESARHMPLEMLKNGAVVDIVAAEILKERGVDVGLISSERLSGVRAERYIDYDSTINDIYSCIFRNIVCNKKASALSTLLPSNTPGSYIYENADGITFVVFAADFCFSSPNKNYYNNYFRQEQLISAIESACKKPLPALSKKHPNLYIMTAKNEKSLSVLLINDFPDDIDNPVITLDKAYGTIKLVNCDGYIKDNKVYLSDITPYGFAAFEVSLK